MNTSTTLTILDARVAAVQVRVTARNGCGTNSQYLEKVYYLPRSFDGNGMHRTTADAPTPPQLYPNPATDRLQIVTASPATRYEYVVVLNAQGTVARKARKGAGVQELSLKGLPAGLYAVRLFGGQQFITQHVRKDRLIRRPRSASLTAFINCMKTVRWCATSQFSYN